MKRSKKDIRTAAWHEAGHATHALVVGVPFKGVWIKRETAEVPPDGLLSRLASDVVPMGAVISDGKTINGVSDYDLIANCMAGLAGERILRGCKKAGRFTPLAFLSGCETDWELAKDYIKQHNDDPRSRFLLMDGIVDTMLESGWKVLKREARTHKAIADALIERGYITHEECKRLHEENA